MKLIRNFYLSTFAILALFLTILGVAVIIAFSRTSNATGTDPAKIQQIRTLAEK